MSTSWADSTVVPSAKVNCRPCLKAHLALGATVFRNRISFGIHVQTPDRHSRWLYFKQIITWSNQYRNTENPCYSNKCPVWGFSLRLVLLLWRYNKTKND